MCKALSVDLRERVVTAIAGGASCREAAARFGVSASSAIRWWALERATGRSGRIEAHAPLILGLIDRTPDVALVEMKGSWPRRACRLGYDQHGPHRWPRPQG